MKFKLPVLNTLLLVAVLAYLVIQSTSNETENGSQAYVITQDLYSEFDYQKELDQEFLAIKNDRLKSLGFLEKEITGLETRLSSSEASDEDLLLYQQRLQEYQKKDRAIQEELLAVSNNYNYLIWEKLNAFTKEFGEQRGYDVIFGTDGNGNILHASEEKNVTEELVSFCNAKYNGIK